MTVIKQAKIRIKPDAQRLEQAIVIHEVSTGYLARLGRQEISRDSSLDRVMKDVQSWCKIRCASNYPEIYIVNLPSSIALLDPQGNQLTEWRINSH